MGRTTNDRVGDRNWHWLSQKGTTQLRVVYPALQCQNQPAIGNLCEKCNALKNTDGTEHGVTKKKGWHGYINDINLSSLPADSHIAGSQWFQNAVAAGKLRHN
jgi:hypothetical protein